VADADIYRRLVIALDDLELWSKLAPLLPFAVHHDHAADRAAQQRRLAQLPSPRRPVGLWPVPRAGHSRFTPPGRKQ